MNGTLFQVSGAAAIFSPCDGQDVGERRAGIALGEHLRSFF